MLNPHCLLCLVAYYTELNLQICDDAFVAKIVNTRLTKVCMAIFTLTERLPTSATLVTWMLLVPCIQESFRHTWGSMLKSKKYQLHLTFNQKKIQLKAICVLVCPNSHFYMGIISEKAIECRLDLSPLKTSPLPTSTQTNRKVSEYRKNGLAINYPHPILLIPSENYNLLKTYHQSWEVELEYQGEH